MSQDEPTIFEMVGGRDTFLELVDRFYDKIEADDELRLIFPDDLEPGKHAQFLFLMQYWGGPNEYSTERGHPRLRMRHSPYPITQELRDRWVQYMMEAIDEIGIEDPARKIMQEYFERGATFMINRYHPQDGDDSE